MQDFIKQAEKNGVILSKNGRCQFCGADFQNGIFDCIETYSNCTGLLDFNNPVYYTSRFLSVDAHALQHPEVHGRWSNHFHLTRLNLILEKKVEWNYKKSPLLSNFLNDYKQDKANEILVPPPQMKRGNLTAKDITKVATPEDCVQLIADWAEGVYQSWKPYHDLVSKIAEGFLNNLSVKR